MATLKLLLRLLISSAIFLLPLIHLTLSLECCNQLYLSSTDTIERDYSYLLGIYIKEGVIRDRPYYGKNVTFPLQNETSITLTYYLIYADKNGMNVLLLVMDPDTRNLDFGSAVENGF